MAAFGSPFPCRRMSRCGLRITRLGLVEPLGEAGAKRDPALSRCSHVSHGCVRGVRRNARFYPRPTIGGGDGAMVERAAEIQDHWTRKGVLTRIDAALTELGHDPQTLTPEILATIEHLHTGGPATTRDQAAQLSLTPNSRVLDIGCGIGGPARHLAHTYGCQVDGIDLTPALVETGRVLTERCGLADRVTLQLGDALDLPFPDETYDAVWCQNVTMNIADKARFLAGAYHVLRPGGLFTSTEFSLGPGGDMIFPVPWAYDASISVSSIPRT